MIHNPDNIGLDHDHQKMMDQDRLETNAAEQVRPLHEVGRNQQELFISLLQGSKAILENSDFNPSAEMLLEKCKCMVHASTGFILTMNPKDVGAEEIFFPDGSFKKLAGSDLPYFFKELRVQAVYGKCSVLENDFRHSKSANFISTNHPVIRNVLMVPLIHKQTNSGMLVLANKPDDFNTGDIAVAEAFAELVALAWINAKNLEDLRIARRKAEECDRLKSSFLSNMSHEIRTPLNGILGFSELLAEPDVDPGEREQYIRIMRQNGDQLLAIINNILDISLIESGQMVLSNEWVDIKSLLCEIYELFMAPGLKKLNVQYILDCEADGNIRLFTDEGRLRQILINLFGNAAKFTMTGSVRLGCRVLDAPDGPELVISVEDTGLGIPNEKIDAIFERFRQADSITTRHYGGTGLGLAISKGLTELLGGRIEVFSKPREGSTFKAIFPMTS